MHDDGGKIKGSGDRRGLGDNRPPREFSKRRWALALFAYSDSKKPLGAVAMGFRLYLEMDNEGRGVALKDQDIAQACGVTDRSVREFKAWLVKTGFVRVMAKGARGGATEYRGCIPGDELPEEFSGNGVQLPEDIAGSRHLEYRKILPEVADELPEKISGNLRTPEEFSGNRSRAEVVIYNKNINNINNINNLTKSHPIEIPSSAREMTREHMDALTDKLVEACNGALDNPVNCLGLASLATPIMWLEQGCDLETDILPTLRGYGKSAHGKRIRSWDYFTRGIQKARDQRVEGMAEPARREPKESEVDKIHRLVRQANERQSRRPAR